MVLVIEDDAGLRESICDILRSAGYEVDSASSSSAGYDRLCAGGVDVIVCDVMLGDDRFCAGSAEVIMCDVMLDDKLGPSMVERFNSNGHSVPALYMSGYEWKTLVKERILPVDAPFLQKPFNLFDLIRWVQTLTSNKKLED